MPMSDTTKPWWEILNLRDEVVSSSGAIDDVQMSLHNAVFGKEGIGAGRTPYANATYFGSITHPTDSLVELMAQVAVRLGAKGSTSTSALWRLDQAMGGGKSHGLIGLWHLATHPEELIVTDLGKKVSNSVENVAGRGAVRMDLGNPICVVLDCDNTTADAEEFGPASRLGERFLWRLFDKDGHKYDAFKEHITNKAKLAEALRSTDRPVLILIDEIMDYMRVVAAKDPNGAVLDMAFLRALLDIINDVPNCAGVLVMIASDKDNMAMTNDGAAHRKELEDLLTRNARTTTVTGGGDFAEIIQRRLFATKPVRGVTDAVATRFLEEMSGEWEDKAFGKLSGWNKSNFLNQCARSYPFHPHLMALAEGEWAQHTGFQRVRSIIRVFASAVYEQSQRARAGQWAPELIDSGDLPLQSSQLSEALFNSGLIADDKTISNLREVARIDIVDKQKPEESAAWRLDNKRDESWQHINPRAAERMATALFIRSLYTRAGGTRGATKAELYAASFVPHKAYKLGDAEAVAANLLETDEGAAAVDEIAGRGNIPKRWVFETRKTLTMLVRAAKKSVTDKDRDSAVTDRAFSIATAGPFDKTLDIVGGDLPSKNLSTQDCIGAIGEADIDNKHQIRLAILDSRWFSLFNGDDAATRESTTAALGIGPDAMAVQWASSAVFACANTAVRSQARGLASEWLAYKRVAEYPTVQADKDMHKQAQHGEREAKNELDRMVRQCYKHIVYLAPKGECKRVATFARMSKDTQTALNGSDVWAELNSASKAFNPGQFNKRALLTNLRDSDYGRPLSEIRDSFWSNPHKPLLPNGSSELRAALFDAIAGKEIELVSPEGVAYTVDHQGDINLADNNIRIRRAVHKEPTPRPPNGDPPSSYCDKCNNPKNSCKCKPGEQVEPPIPPTVPTKPLHLQVNLSINTSVDSENPDEKLLYLMQELINRIDDGTIAHIHQMTQLTVVVNHEVAKTLRELAGDANASISIREI